MRVRVVVNPGAGSVDEVGRLLDEIVSAFASAGAEATADVVEPADVADTITSWWEDDDRPDVIVAAGGDGSVNCVASAAVGTDMVISVLPLGTFNHFASDLGIPDDLGEAAAAIVGGDVRAVDVGEVDGRVFVNNSALGVYPAMVDVRDRIRDRRGWGKVRSVPVACGEVLRRLPVHRLDLHGSGGLERRRVRTSFVFVGNGRYDNGVGGTPERTSLDSGTLYVAVTRTETRVGLIRTALRALTSGTARARDLDEVEVAEITIGGRSRRLLVARDGEIDEMHLPLRYRSRPGALSVRAPTPEPGTARSVEDAADGVGDDVGFGEGHEV